jgi:hypothetical protein
MSMPIRSHVNGKETPMTTPATATSPRANAAGSLVSPRANAAGSAHTTTRARSTAMSLVNEALSLARMRMPQNSSSEARRPARHIAMQARNRQDRDLSNLSQTGIR